MSEPEFETEMKRSKAAPSSLYEVSIGVKTKKDDRYRLEKVAQVFECLLANGQIEINFDEKNSSEENLLEFFKSAPVGKLNKILKK